MKLYFNPVSSYSQKTLMAFYEKDVPFEPVAVNLFDPKGREEFRKIHPLCKVPYLHIEDQDWNVPESSIIIEYLDQKFPDKGTKLIPSDPDRARQTRMRDRFFDFYVNDTMQKIFFDSMRPAGKNDPFGVEQAKERLQAAYEILDKEMANKTWAMGDDFTLADCAAAPALGYTRVVFPFDQFKNVTAYANRLAERPSFQRVMKDAAPILAQMGFGKK